MGEFGHTPVLLNEVLNGLTVRPDGCYVDCTFGRGGHSEAILQSLDVCGCLFVFDKDPDAIAYARKKFNTDKRVTCIHGSFTRLAKVVTEHGYMGRVDGVLLDLGLSSPQVDDSSRGFSFMRDGELDMRMDPTTGISASQWINHARQEEIADVLRTYGEERYARRIAAEIVRMREEQPLIRTGQLAKLIEKALPVRERDKHPATRSFQAIRIFINRELDELHELLKQIMAILADGGRLVVISFHSLEDRIIKRFMREAAAGDPYPKDLPVKAAELKPRLKIIGKPIRPGGEEVLHNPRARSAVLRVAEKTAA